LEAPAGFAAFAPLQDFALSAGGGAANNLSSFKDLELLAGETILRESFADIPQILLHRWDLSGDLLPGWDFVSGAIQGSLDWLSLRHGAVFCRRTEAFTDFRLTVTSIMRAGGRIGVSVGSDSSQIELIADAEDHRAILTWSVLLGVCNDLIAIDDEGQSEIIKTFASIISDVKVWEDRGEVGVCLPEINRVAIRVVLGGLVRFPPTREIGDDFPGFRPGQFN
jgi:hypothetical protein